jgi:hypothetical protein
MPAQGCAGAAFGSGIGSNLGLSGQSQTVLTGSKIFWTSCSSIEKMAVNSMSGDNDEAVKN